MESHVTSGNPQLNYTRLLLGMLVTLIVSLSIHVFMLQVLRIPFPDFAGLSAWAPWLNTTLSLFALILVCAAAQPRIGQLSRPTQCLIVFLLYALLKESFRGIIMSGVVTTAWRFDMLDGLPSLTYALILSSLVVFLTPVLRSLWARLGGAAVLAGIAVFALRPAIVGSFAPLLKAAAYLDHPEVYPFPYGWHVLIPAYITYAEPVIAATCIAYLVWDQLSPERGVRILQFSLLVLSIRGMLLPTFIYSFFSKAKLPTAMLSQSQFLLETLALAILTTIVWQLSIAKQLSSPNSVHPRPLAS